MREDGVLRVGIVGAGWIAEKAAITLNGLRECECRAIASRSLEKALAFAAKWGVRYPMDDISPSSTVSLH